MPQSDASHHGRRRAVTRLVVAALAVGTGGAVAQAWPSRPVRVVVPFGAGGGGTIQARLLADPMARATGGTFVIDNRPGAGGLIGAQIVAEAPADGYTVLFTTSTLAVNTTLLASSLKFDPRRDLQPVSHVSSAPLVFCVHPSVPARSVRELIDIARKSPGKLAAAVNEIGSTGHLASVMLNQLARVDTTIVPYKGGGPALIGLMTGDVAMLFAVAPVAMPHLQTKRVRGLAVTTPRRASAFPDLPPINTFVPGLETDVWYAVFLPKGAPLDVVNRLSSEVARALQTEAVQAFYKREGLDPVGSAPEGLRAHLDAEITKYARVIREGNIRSD